MQKYVILLTVNKQVYTLAVAKTEHAGKMAVEHIENMMHMFVPKSHAAMEKCLLIGKRLCFYRHNKKFKIKLADMPGSHYAMRIILFFNDGHYMDDRIKKYYKK